VKILPRVLVRSRQNTVVHHRAMVATGAHTWPHFSTPP
jgi:hypothetical protein